MQVFSTFGKKKKSHLQNEVRPDSGFFSTGQKFGCGES